MQTAMCGIAGFVGRGDEGDLQSMTAALIQRGPDAGGAWRDESAGVWLGHRRLRVVDIESGAQPMASADGALVVVFNGEIYNHAELRKELEDRGHAFRSHHSDTEVLLHAYREWGALFVERLNGMWAFALYDRGRRRLLLSRDRFAKKPLYYSCQNRTFAFASELTALLQHPRVPATVSSAAVRKYFAYGYVPAPASLYERIHKLPGGCNLSLDLDEGTPRLERYWEFVIEPFERIPPRAEEVWGDELRERLARAVERRLVADVPVGVFLSGGIDSSSVAALAARSGGGEPVRTFAIGFEEASFDESAWAARAAEAIGTRHRCTMFSADRALEVLPRVLESLDEPSGDSSILPTYLLCREARQEVTVALGGDGADELFAGYDPFRALRAAAWYRRLVPRPVHRAIRLLAARLPVSLENLSLDFRIKRTLRGLSGPPALWNPLWLGPLEPAELAEMLAEPVDLEEVYAEAIHAWEGCSNESNVDRTLQFFTRLYLQDDILAKLDRASMMNSLEVRSPYLDLDVVDFVRRLPHHFKLRGGETKYLLKRALAPVLPAEILQRPKKGFGVPVARWVREGRLPLAAPDAAEPMRRFFEKRLASHRAGRSDERLYLWSHHVLDRIMARDRSSAGLVA